MSTQLSQGNAWIIRERDSRIEAEQQLISQRQEIQIILSTLTDVKQTSQRDKSELLIQNENLTTRIFNLERDLDSRTDVFMKAAASLEQRVAEHGQHIATLKHERASNQNEFTLSRTQTAADMGLLRQDFADSKANELHLSHQLEDLANSIPSITSSFNAIISNNNQMIQSQFKEHENLHSRFDFDLKKIAIDQKGMNQRLFKIGQGLAAEVGSIWQEVSAIKTYTNLIVV